jgi:ComF family protein
MPGRTGYKQPSTYKGQDAVDTVSLFPADRHFRRFSIVRYFLRLLLPPVCHFCNRPIAPETSVPDICTDCFSSCIRQPGSACPICAEPYRASVIAIHPCSMCANHPPAFVWLKTIGIHQDTLLHAVHRLKYAGAFHLAKPLTQLLLQRAYSEISEFSPQAIIPVPLHSSRLRQRGYNQALLVARHLGASLCIPTFSRYLIRIRATQSQTDLTRIQRQQNLRGAFVTSGYLAPQRLLLVDDVVTTTSTSRECASILTSAGHEVAVVALSRAQLKS